MPAVAQRRSIAMHSEKKEGKESNGSTHAPMTKREVRSADDTHGGKHYAESSRKSYESHGHGGDSPVGPTNK